MTVAILTLIELIQRELMFFASCCFLIGSIDDLTVDILWIIHNCRLRLCAGAKVRSIQVEPLKIESWDQNLAIFVPAWDEAQVIGGMLQRCLTRWAGEEFIIYVGCYPNDAATIAVVDAVAKRGEGRIRMIICDRAGPTSKAHCLNNLWRALCRDELTQNRQYAAIILHDAEDIVHPQELHLFHRLIAEAALVQIPVIPRRAKGSRWVAGHYCDEFAEAHGKQMVVREALGVAIPLAGVGCAISRAVLHELAEHTDNGPFDAASLTEDYELGLKISGGKARGIFARLRDQHGQLVATQEFFPNNLHDAVRQKARWMVGIGLAGWDRLGWCKGWKGSWRENWMRLRDRKASFGALIVAIAYAVALIQLLLFVFAITNVYQPQPVSQFLRIVLTVNLLAMIWRLAVKCYFVHDLYGYQEALLAVPRTFVANAIDILAAWRALTIYLNLLSGGPICWEKTPHFYPRIEQIQKLRQVDGVATVESAADR